MTETRFSRRTLASGIGALAALPLLGRTGTSAADGPTGHLILAELDRTTGEPAPGLRLLDLAAGTQTTVTTPVVNRLVGVRGTTFAVAVSGEDLLLVDGRVTAALPLTPLTPRTPATDVADVVRRAFPPGSTATVSVASVGGRWALLTSGVAFRALIDLRRFVIADLEAELDGTDVSLQNVSLVLGTDLLLAEVGDELRLVDPDTLETQAVLGTFPGIIGVEVSPGGRRAAWTSYAGEGDGTLTHVALAGQADAGGDLEVPGIPGSPVWVDDDVLLLPFTVAGEGSTLRWTDLAGGGHTDLATFPDGVARPAALAGGTRALVALDVDGGTRWSLLDIGSGALVELPVLADDVPLMPTDLVTRAVLFGPTLPGSVGRLRLLNAATGTVTGLLNLGTDNTTYDRPIVAPGGRSAIVDVRGEGVARCELIDLARRTVTSLDAAAAFAPDGRHLLTWQADPATGDRTTLQLRDLDGTILREVGCASWAAWVA